MRALEMSTSQRKLKAAEDAGYRCAVQDFNLRLFGWALPNNGFDDIVKRLQEQRETADAHSKLCGFVAACGATSAPESVLSLIRGCGDLNGATNVWRAFQLGYAHVRAAEAPPAPTVHGVVLTDEERRQAKQGLKTWPEKMGHGEWWEQFKAFDDTA